MPTALIIEDDEIVSHDIAHALASDGFSVDVSHSGREGVACALANKYEVIILDWLLPDIDGLKIIALIRGIGINTPVLMVSSRSDLEYCVEALRAGCDDYLTKPLSREEILARVGALLRRRSRFEGFQIKIRVGSLEIDLIEKSAKRNSTEIELHPTEFRLLEYLMQHANQVLTRTMIFEAVWGCRFDPGTNLIDVHIAKLRRKIDVSSERSMILTVRGSGYVLRADTTEES